MIYLSFYPCLGPFEETIKAVRLLVLLLDATCSLRSRCRGVWNGFSRSSGGVWNCFGSLSARTALSRRWDGLFCLTSTLLHLWLRRRFWIFLLCWFDNNIGFLPFRFGICSSAGSLLLFCDVSILLSFSVPLTRIWCEPWVERQIISSCCVMSYGLLCLQDRISGVIFLRKDYKSLATKEKRAQKI